MSLLVAASTGADELREDKIGEAKKVHSFGQIYMSAQPSQSDLKRASEQGIKTVITLRTKSELNWDEARVVEQLGMEFHAHRFLAPKTLKKEIFDECLALLADQSKHPILIHCGSANRVGAIWLAHRVVNDGVSIEAAKKEARIVGLKTQDFEDRAIQYAEYIQSEKEEKSVRPGINKSYLNPKLDVSEWLGRFEIESREVYAARNEILKHCKIESGMVVADIGAGTGFYSSMFASTVGDRGWVYSVDIAPKFLEHINKKALEDDVKNLTCVLGTDRSINLQLNSVDLVFVCDTYHHFEYPKSTLASIKRALKPGGQLIVIDFERIAGKSRPFIMGHVRAGKQVFRKEIMDAGFVFEEEVKVDGLKENYFLRFKKK